MQTESKSEADDRNDDVALTRVSLHFFNLGVFRSDCLLAGLVVGCVSLLLILELLFIVRSYLCLHSERRLQIRIVFRQDRNLDERVNWLLGERQRYVEITIS